MNVTYLFKHIWHLILFFKLNTLPCFHGNRNCINARSYFNKACFKISCWYLTKKNLSAKSSYKTQWIPIFKKWFSYDKIVVDCLFKIKFWNLQGTMPMFSFQRLQIWRHVILLIGHFSLKIRMTSRVCEQRTGCQWFLDDQNHTLCSSSVQLFCFALSIHWPRNKDHLVTEKCPSTYYNFVTVGWCL